METRSPTTSLPFKRQVTEQTAVKWSIIRKQECELVQALISQSV